MCLYTEGGSLPNSKRQLLSVNFVHILRTCGHVIWGSGLVVGRKHQEQLLRDGKWLNTENAQTRSLKTGIQAIVLRLPEGWTARCCGLEDNAVLDLSLSVYVLYPQIATRSLTWFAHWISRMIIDAEGHRSPVRLVLGSRDHMPS